MMESPANPGRFTPSKMATVMPSHIGNTFQKIAPTSEGVLYYRNQPRSGSYPPLTVQQNVMCSRPGPRKPIRHERGEPIFWLPPIIFYRCPLFVPLKIPCPQGRDGSTPSSDAIYFPETSERAFRMLSEVMPEMPYKVFVFPVRESSTTTEGVPGTLNFFVRVLKYCMPATTSA